MTRDDKDIVLALRTALADRVGKERFELWFGPRTRLEWDGHALGVGTPTQFYLDWIRSNFRRDIETVCMESLGTCPPLKFYVQGDVADLRTASPNAQHADAAAKSPASLSAKPAATNEYVAGGRADKTRSAASDNTADKAGIAAEGARPLTGKVTPATDEPSSAAPARRKFAALSSYVVGQSNRLALVSAEMVARNPGQITPLLIHGPTSVGKTHLLEGIWSATRKANRGVAPVYLSAEQFTSQFLEALRGSGLPSFRRKYRGVGMLIVDDLQFLARARATQVELLHTIDTLLREGKQVVFSCDRPPMELTEFLPELTTRLAGGMVCRIEPPDFNTRLGIVGHLAARLCVELPAEVQRFVASRLTSHARELSGAICRLQATSAATGQKITLGLAEEALREMIHNNSRVVRLSDIQSAVCKVFGIEADNLQAEGRSKRHSHPRMLAMWLARKHTRAALSEIGDFFGHRSHSTVISAQKRVDQWMAEGESLHLANKTWSIDEAVRQVERQLTAS